MNFKLGLIGMILHMLLAVLLSEGPLVNCCICFVYMVKYVQVAMGIY